MLYKIKNINNGNRDVIIDMANVNFIQLINNEVHFRFKDGFGDVILPQDTWFLELFDDLINHGVSDFGNATLTAENDYNPAVDVYHELITTIYNLKPQKSLNEQDIWVYYQDYEDKNFNLCMFKVIDILSIDLYGDVTLKGGHQIHLYTDMAQNVLTNIQRDIIKLHNRYGVEVLSHLDTGYKDFKRDNYEPEHEF